MMGTPNAVRLGALLAATLLASGAAFSAAEPDPSALASVVSVTQLPPPPPHEWANLDASVQENRVHGNGLVSMPQLQTYLDGLYAKIKASAGVPDWPGQVYISADTTLNAHSSASGNLFLHIALIQSAESEDEIYAVLAHEFAHVYLNHQATYEAHNVAANLSTLGMVLGRVAGKITGNVGGAVKWGLGDTIGAANSLAHDSLIPVWQRDVEQQADMAGVYLSMLAKYSYPAGFKTFLERLITIEQREAAVAAAAAAEAQKAGTVAASGSAPRRTHATAQERETLLTERVTPVLPRPRPTVRKAPWQAALREKQTAEILAHFALLPAIAQAHAAGKHGDALKLARKAASGTTEGDGTMLLTLQNAMQQNGVSRLDQSLLLMRSKDSKQPSWNAMRQGLTLGFLPAEPAQGSALMAEAFKLFGEVPAAMPDVIAFYTQANNVVDKNLMAARCLPYASVRQACLDAANTEQERAEALAKAKAREEQLSTNAVDKFKKMFKMN